MKTRNILINTILILLFVPSMIFAQAGFDILGGGTEAFVDPGDIYSFEMTLINTGPETDDFLLSLTNEDVPEDWTTSFCIGGLCYTPAIREVTETIAPLAAQSVWVDFHTLAEGVGYVSLTIQSGNDPELETTLDFTLYAGDPPAVEVFITPVEEPVQVEAGGSILFDAEIRNNTEEVLQGNAWTEVVLSNETTFGPIVNANVTLQPGQELTFTNLELDVPVFAPPGDYTYVAKLGIFPGFVQAEDMFDFEVIVNEGAADNNEWQVYGWDDGPEFTSDKIPTEFKIYELYPNPFNSSLNISLSLPVASQVEIGIYNSLGQLVSNVKNGYFSGGSHNLTWNAEKISSGTYYLKVYSPSFGSLTRNIVYLK